LVPYQPGVNTSDSKETLKETKGVLKKKNDREEKQDDGRSPKKGEEKLWGQRK